MGDRGVHAGDISRFSFYSASKQKSMKPKFARFVCRSGERLPVAADYYILRARVLRRFVERT